MHVEQRDVLYTEYYKMTSVTLLYLLPLVFYSATTFCIDEIR